MIFKIKENRTCSRIIQSNNIILKFSQGDLMKRLKEKRSNFLMPCAAVRKTPLIIFFLYRIDSFYFQAQFNYKLDNNKPEDISISNVAKTMPKGNLCFSRSLCKHPLNAPRLWSYQFIFCLMFSQIGWLINCSVYSVSRASA